MTYIAMIVFFFVECLPEHGRKRPIHVGELPHVCILLYLIIVHLSEYMWYGVKTLLFCLEVCLGV
jgi:hypothetical protein